MSLSQYCDDVYVVLWFSVIISIHLQDVFFMLCGGLVFIACKEENSPL